MSVCWFMSLAEPVWPMAVPLPLVSTDPSAAIVVSLAPPASVEAEPSAIVVSPEALLSDELSEAIELSLELSDELSDAIELSLELSEDMLLSDELSDAIELSLELSDDMLLSDELSDAIELSLELSDDMLLSDPMLSRPAEARVIAPACWSIGSRARNSSQVIIALLVCAAAKAGAADRVIAMALAPLRRTLVIMTNFLAF